MNFVGDEQHLKGAGSGRAAIADDSDHLISEKIGIAINAVADPFAEQLLFPWDVQAVARYSHGENYRPGKQGISRFESEAELAAHLLFEVKNVLVE
jgi:hypothetical protein